MTSSTRIVGTDDGREYLMHGTSEFLVDVCLKRMYDATAEEIFDAWLDPAARGLRLLPTVTGRIVQSHCDPLVGGSFSLVERHTGGDTTHTGRFLELDRPGLLVFTLSHRHCSHPDSRVVIEIVSLGSGCEVSLTHVCVTGDCATRIEQGWADVLEELATGMVPESPLRTAEHMTT